MTGSRKRPPSVPDGAWWEESEKRWVLGELDRAGKRRGIFHYWRADGTLCLEEMLADGVGHGPYRRFFENGEISGEGMLRHGKRHGICIRYRGTAPTPTLPAGISDRVWRIEHDYVDGVLQAERLYDRDGQQVDAGGEPVARRPAGVPLDAQFLPRKKRWFAGQRTSGTPFGLWRYWDEDGNPFVEVSYTDGVGHPHALQGVPAGAVWNDREETWELGEVVEDKPVGAWRWWRPCGQLVCESSFDRHGQLDGPSVRFHPDGASSRRGTYLLGKEHGTIVYLRSRGASSEHFPAPLPIWRVEQEYEGGELRAVRHFLEDGTGCNARGIPLASAFQDRWFTETTPDVFLEKPEGLEAFLGEAGLMSEPKETVVLGIEQLQELWGRPMPPDLRRALTLIARTGQKGLYEWRSEPVGFPLPEEDGTNVLEQIISQEQQGPAGTLLTDLLSGTLLIGALGNGDTYHVSLYDQEMGLQHGQVYLYDVETAYLTDPVARDVASLCYLCALCHAREELDAVSPEGFAEAFGRLRGRVNVPWHFRDLQRHAGVSDEDFTFRSDRQQSRVWFYRSSWIRYLLRNDKARGVEGVLEVFERILNPAIPDELHRQFLQNAPRLVPTALYLLFRHFFFDNACRLAEVISACKESPARLIRDAAVLVQALQAGPRPLGSIGDMQALRERFLALKLDPDRAA